MEAVQQMRSKLLIRGGPLLYAAYGYGCRVLTGKLSIFKTAARNNNWYLLQPYYPEALTTYEVKAKWVSQIVL